VARLEARRAPQNALVGAEPAERPDRDAAARTLALDEVVGGRDPATAEAMVPTPFTFVLGRAQLVAWIRFGPAVLDPALLPGIPSAEAVLSPERGAQEHECRSPVLAPVDPGRVAHRVSIADDQRGRNDLPTVLGAQGRSCPFAGWDAQRGGG
jgi:hypothetical protein